MLINYLKTIFMITACIMVLGCSQKETLKTKNISSSQTLIAPNITSNFWKISKPGEPDSYLIGSIHFGKPDDQLPIEILQVIKKIDYVYTEVKFPDNVNNTDDVDFLEFKEKIYDVKSGKTLSDKIGSQRTEKIKKLLAEIKEKKQILLDIEHLEPWILPIYLPQIIVERSFSTQKGIDYLIISQAKALHKTLNGLEKHMFRYQILKDTPLDLILNEIDQIISNPLLAEISISNMYTFYHSGHHFQIIGNSLNSDNLIASVFQNQKTIQSAKWLQTELLQKRNQHWIPKILSVLPKQKNLLVVGLLHLYGPTGIVQQLRNYGYTVTPIMLKNN